MRESILKAVAAPPKLFWAPFLPAIANLGIQFPFMFISMGLWGANPIMFAVPIVLGHAFLIGKGSQEPHLSTMMQSQGPLMGPSKNMYKSRGTKLAP